MENLISFLALFLSIFLVTKLVFSGNKNSPPSPFSLPLIGHLYLFIKPLSSLHQTLHQLSLKHGPIFSLQLGCRSFLVLSSPSAVEECFTKHDIIFANRPKTLAGDCLTYDYTSPTWSPYGELWRSLRRLGTIEIFSQKSLNKFSAMREQEVCSFVRQIFKVSNKVSPKVNSQYLFSLLMWNIITRLLAGKQCIEEETAITDLGEQYLKEIKEKFFPSVSLSMGACDFFPILRWVGYKGLEKNIVAVYRKRDRFCQSLIEEIRQKKTSSLNNHTTKLEFGERTNLIETLLSLQESEPENYSENVIKSIISTTFIAGTEASANTMIWATSLLLNHPEVLKKVRAEIEHHVGHKRLLKDSDIPKLTYLKFVIKETLRLYPPAPLLLPRSSSEECIVGGFQIPKDTVLLVNAWAIHSDPNVWEEPDAFKPDRFEASLMDGERDRVEFKFIPFGAGRRACPGAAMAIRTVCLAMGSLIQCFDLERDGKELGDMSTDLGRTFKMNKPLNAVFTARRVMADVLSEL